MEKKEEKIFNLKINFELGKIDSNSKYLTINENIFRIYSKDGKFSIVFNKHKIDRDYQLFCEYEEYKPLELYGFVNLNKEELYEKYSLMFDAISKTFIEKIKKYSDSAKKEIEQINSEYDCDIPDDYALTGLYSYESYTEKFNYLYKNNKFNGLKSIKNTMDEYFPNGEFKGFKDKEEIIQFIDTRTEFEMRIPKITNALKQYKDIIMEISIES
jgi:hypothetical protein